MVLLLPEPGSMGPGNEVCPLANAFSTPLAKSQLPALENLLLTHLELTVLKPGLLPWGWRKSRLPPGYLGLHKHKVKKTATKLTKGVDQESHGETYSTKEVQ